MGLFRSALKFIGLAGKASKGFTMVGGATKKASAVARFSAKRAHLHQAARNVAAGPDPLSLLGQAGLPSAGRAVTHGIVMATKSNRNAALAVPVGLAGAAAVYSLALPDNDGGW